MAFRLRANSRSLLTSLVFFSLLVGTTGCLRLFGNAEPYGNKPSSTDASNGAPYQPGPINGAPGFSPTFECLDPDYTCQESSSPRNRLDPLGRRLLGDLCGAGARPLAVGENPRASLIAGVATLDQDRCIYVDQSQATLSEGGVPEIFCTLGDRIHILIETDNAGELRGIRADRASGENSNIVSVQTGKVYQMGRRYEGSGFTLTLSPAYTQATLSGETQELSCRARPY